LTRTTATATPLSIYPRFASMASSPAQKATTVIQPTTFYGSIQEREQAAVYGQCARAFPGCTPFMADTALGF
jgi:hypothetical protein